MNIVRLAVLGAALAVPALAAAQAPPETKVPIAPKTEQLDRNACANNRATVGQGGDMDMQKPQGQSLSDHLARSDGVICPPAQVDPEIKVPTPPGGSMKVIPPPGTPGSDPNLQPK
ncbi:MAG: hypothetical protein WAM62_05510 [Pseudolabrys sp.]